MAKKTSLRQIRIYSEELRKCIVEQIESGSLTVAQAHREYGMNAQTIYNWLYKYSRSLKKGTRIVMEKDSHDKTNVELKKQIKQLEAALGRKSLEADLYRTIVDLASKEYKVDLKKNFGEEPSKSSDQ